ncbi:MAG: thiamine pyrophosphate-dependent enzyme [Thermoanaerobaculia bacterium]
MLKLAEKQAAASAVRVENPVPKPRREPRPVPEPRKAHESRTVVSALTEHLTDLGVEQAFGVSGGAIALFFDALVDSAVQLRHFRHETGAAFAALEAHFATGKPTVVFTTTGPGLLNSLTGMTAARWDGGKVILISGATTSPQRGRWATQETSPYTLPQDGLYSKGPIFDFAVRVESPAELPEVFRRLALGLAQPGGFVAHVSLPMGVQSKRIDSSPSKPNLSLSAPAAAPADVRDCARLLKQGSFAIWAGFGATGAADQVLELVERSGAKIFCSPRAKGVVPENHPSFLGVSGLGGYGEVTDYMVTRRPRWVLVLGSRLGEPTSFWDRDLLPVEGFIHVDLDPEVPGTAFPDFNTIGIQAEIGHFLDALLPYFPADRTEPATGESPLTDSEWSRKAAAAGPVGVEEVPEERRPTPCESPAPLLPSDLAPSDLSSEGLEPEPEPRAGQIPVRPRVLMSALQRHVVCGSDAVVLAECGNSFAWCNHHLRFPSPGRYRVSTLFGSMGHAAAGVVGAALARGGKAVAVVGDGSMLMNSELSTAVQYRAQAVWVVLNDAGYGMCRDGHRALGLTEQEVDIPRVDFVAMARAVGADGVLLETEEQVDEAMQQAMAATGPFVVDVRIDTDDPSPLLKRFESLIKQGNSKNVAGWDK